MLTEVFLADLARATQVRRLKIYWATHYALFISPVTGDIANAINVSPQKIQDFRRSPVWNEAIEFWNVTNTEDFQIYASAEEHQKAINERGSLRFAANQWKHLIRNGYDLNPTRIDDDVHLSAFLDPQWGSPIGIEYDAVTNRIRRILHRVLFILIHTPFFISEVL